MTTRSNPYGKTGGPAHQAAIAETKRDLQKEGYIVTTEAFVPIPEGGHKSVRYADILASKKEEALYVQVGRKNKNGTPVSRERKALEDLKRAKKNVRFIPYN